MTAPADPNSLIWALNTRLIAGATATETLLAWCEEHGLPDGPITVDVHQRFAPAIIPEYVLPALALDPGETVHYRQVQLMRGTLPLATAGNWFVPQRLTAAMNEALNMTETPFGRVIAPLRPVRRILEQVALIRSGSEPALALVKEGYLLALVSAASAPGPRIRDWQPERSALRTVRRER
ncbi:hypothetical protein [Microvirga lotononidis]|uniref:Uncharacterized protein n=1 Tax=Microvirga lotononidis TaxID=864069 RepID=I4Z424_9HYPH|nr:hypothetical protein [Microvirga lotononidis]EIM30966.1 hypothetical protein MicloDRAFT_00004970 [Microvirga lotononidis]WQO30271.1 hypothetical protein U0023_28700 [Microvirga lotononidis]